MIILSSIAAGRLSDIDVRTFDTTLYSLCVHANYDCNFMPLISQENNRERKN